jgi:hypothetical protein
MSMINAIVQPRACPRVAISSTLAGKPAAELMLDFYYLGDALVSLGNQRTLLGVDDFICSFRSWAKLIS